MVEGLVLQVMESWVGPGMVEGLVLQVMRRGLGWWRGWYCK